ncbi:MAG: hypothetical protein JSW48_01160, partial [Betaproteobacteria bacterium]
MGARAMHTLAIGGAALLTLGATILLAPSGSGAAENAWRLASDSAEGDLRFLVDVSHLDHYVNSDGVQLFGVPLRAVGNGIVEDGYVVIDAES